MKNLNSISNVKAAIEYEIERQTEILDAGGSVVQETRRWDVDQGCVSPCAARRKRTITAIFRIPI